MIVSNPQAIAVLVNALLLMRILLKRMPIESQDQHRLEKYCKAELASRRYMLRQAPKLTQCLYCSA